MLVYFFRHGIAQDRADADCPPDPERALTDVGRKRTRAAAQGLKCLDVEVQAIWTSPYVRARETAQIAGEVLAGAGMDLHVTEALEPHRDPEDLFTELSAAKLDLVMCVGHAPQLDLALAYGVGASDAYLTRLKKAGAACVEWPGPRHGEGRLIWLMPPKVLRRLGSGDEAV